MKAVILAAGKGTRLEPLTNTMPKCMLPLAGKPILEHIVLAMRGAGITDIVMVVGYRSEDIMTYFGD
ncbi:MAG: sugar phosphate nucleotidyltransferase, partial [Candidatus Hydrothermarchaeota archaeon]|nr:sugar phosphate nucleotidyltransferase [Candidatus Hydrothermarchaeota archaeon]